MQKLVTEFFVYHIFQRKSVDAIFIIFDKNTTYPWDIVSNQACNVRSGIDVFRLS